MVGNKCVKTFRDKLRQKVLHTLHGSSNRYGVDINVQKKANKSLVATLTLSHEIAIWMNFLANWINLEASAWKLSLREKFNASRSILRRSKANILMSASFFIRKIAQSAINQFICVVKNDLIKIFGVFG
jgi:hypothetical protein